MQEDQSHSDRKFVKLLLFSSVHSFSWIIFVQKFLVELWLKSRCCYKIRAKTIRVSSCSVSLPHWAHVTFTQLRSDPNASSATANDKRVHNNHTFPSFQGRNISLSVHLILTHSVWNISLKSLIEIKRLTSLATFGDTKCWKNIIKIEFVWKWEFWYTLVLMAFKRFVMLDLQPWRAYCFHFLSNMTR